MIHKIKPAAFLLIKTNVNAFKMASSIRQWGLVVWTSPVYGPYQIVAYVEADDEMELLQFIEDLRSRRDIVELDARMCKPIPGDEKLTPLQITAPKSAVLLVTVNYNEEKEKTVAYNLRKLKGIRLARALWGPTDIIAIAEASDDEAMRNLICDEVKLMRGVKANTTLYCYPAG